MFRISSLAAVRRVIAVAAFLAAAPLARADVLYHWSFDELTGPDHDTLAESTGHFNAENAKMNALASDKTQLSLNVASDVPFGKAVTFTGRPGSYLDVPAITGIHQSSFTIAVWVYLTKNDHNYVLTDWTGPQNFSYAFGFDIPRKGGSGMRISAYMNSEMVKTNNKSKEKYNPSILRFNPAATISLNAWHHVAWVWDREDSAKGTLTIYLDGVKVDAATVARGITTNLLNNHRSVRIGLKQDTDSTFNGSMDELWVFNEALAPDQITNLMKTNDINTAPPPPPQVAEAPSAIPVAPIAAAATPGTPAALIAASPPPPPAASPVPTVAAVPDAAPTAIAPAAPEPLAAAPTPIAPPPVNNAPAETLQPAAPVAPPAVYTPAAVAVTTPHYTPERMLGILATGSLSLFLSGFLIWASKERGRLHTRR
jgi:hypothetical protein